MWSWYRREPLWVDNFSAIFISSHGSDIFQPGYMKALVWIPPGHLDRRQYISHLHPFRRLTMFWFPNRYDKARQIKEDQDQYCAKVLAGRWDDLGGEGFPEELQWEALVDILRGKVKVQCFFSFNNPLTKCLRHTRSKRIVMKLSISIISFA